MKLISITTLLFLVFNEASFSQNKNEWKKVEEDLEILSLEPQNQTFFKSELLLFKSSLKKFKLEVVKATQIGKKTSTVKSIANKTNAKLAINASFFDENNKPIGLIIRNGNKVSPLHKGGRTLNSLIDINRHKINIINRKDFIPQNSLWALQAGPQLIKNGSSTKKLKESTKLARRSGVCLTGKKELILYITTGIRGFSFSELIDLLTKNPVNCVNALNLDGGGSSQLYLNTENTQIIDNQANIYIPGQEEVPVVLALYYKQ